MTSRRKCLAAFLATAAVTNACGGGDSSGPAATVPPPTTPVGTLSVAISDDPWHQMASMVLHITGIEFGMSNGQTIHVELPGGSMSVDVMQLQNGAFVQLLSEVEMPAGDYAWMRLQLDLDQSYIDMRNTGGRHGLRMGPNSQRGLELQEPFQIRQGVHADFMLDFDVRQGVRHQHMGMMGDQFELRSALRLIHMNEAGGITGTVDAAMIHLNHRSCDPVNGSNWIYVFPGDAPEPDDIAVEETDGIPGPIATDRVEMNSATGDHGYRVAFLPAGEYRLALTCSGEWDQDGDDDYPSDPDEKFDFLMFSGPIEIIAGQMHRQDF